MRNKSFLHGGAPGGLFWKHSVIAHGYAHIHIRKDGSDRAGVHVTVPHRASIILKLHKNKKELAVFFMIDEKNCDKIRTDFQLNHSFALIKLKAFSSISVHPSEMRGGANETEVRKTVVKIILGYWIG